MGLTFSAPLSEESMSNEAKGQNIQKLADAKVEDNILDTLNLSELTPPAAKLQMPLIGGYDYTSEGDFAYNFPKAKTQKKERYNNYDLFNVMAELEAKKNIVGGNLEKGELQNDEKHQSTSTDPGMSALKSILVEEMNKYKNKNSENGSITGGGDCGCTGNTKVLEGGKKKKGKKSKKSKKVMKGGISSSSESSSDENNFKLKREDVATSNEDLEENGLSIFKYNSSDVSNQTSSERNFRMLRRKM